MAALLLALAAGACERDSTATEPLVEAKTWPAGTVLVVDDVPITVDEVDLASVYAQRVQSAASEAQLRRLALTNVALPRAIAQALAPQARAEAEQRARQALGQLRDGSFGPPKPDGTYGERLSGDWTDLGLVAWGVATDLPEGQWSEVLEGIGHFMILRRLERHEGPVPMATVVAVDALVFPWLPSETVRSEVEAAYDRCRLTIVDPQWRTIVPEQIQYRMGVHQSR